MIASLLYRFMTGAAFAASERCAVAAATSETAAEYAAWTIRRDIARRCAISMAVCGQRRVGT